MSNDPYQHLIAPNNADASITVQYQKTAAKKAVQCGHKASSGDGSGFTREIVDLLHRRLRLASLIMFVTAAFFLARNLLIVGSQITPDSLTLFLHGGLVAFLGLTTGMLWSRASCSMFRLRIVEIGIFGVLALYFAYLQFATLHHAREIGLLVANETENSLHLANLANGFRWFALIVVYGTFIPNTWKRCAIVVMCMVLTPILLTFFACTACAVIGPYKWSALFDLMIMLDMGAAIAIFGSHKISSLQRAAFEARKLGQYQLGEKLGAGGMGEVYRAKHTLLQRECAIKLIRPDQAGDPTNLLRFEREVKAMAKLTHWNSVEVYDYGHSEEGTFYYVMEYLPGLSLQEIVDDHGPLPPSRAVHFLRQICTALHEAHGMGLIHRDIKPSNVFVCQRGGVCDVVKLLDFGLVQSYSMAKGAEKLTVQGAILGSPPYISPEQALGKIEIDDRTDVYSIGGLAHFLLTGNPPFVRETAMELMIAHVHETPTPMRDANAEIPEELEDIVMRCLQKKPEERFINVDELERALALCDCAEEWNRDDARHWWDGVEDVKEESRESRKEAEREVAMAR